MQAVALAELSLKIEERTSNLEVKSTSKSEFEQAMLETRRDIAELKHDLNNVDKHVKELDVKLNHEITLVCQEMTTKNAELKSDLIKWVVGASAGQLAIIVPLLLPLLKLLH